MPLWSSLHPLPQQIPSFAPLAEAGDAAVLVAMEHLAIAWPSGNEEHIRHFRPQHLGWMSWLLPFQHATPGFESRRFWKASAHTGLCTPACGDPKAQRREGWYATLAPGSRPNANLPAPSSTYR